jgi:cytosine/adenosine deaminase-related metal-dependent hydrolase
VSNVERLIVKGGTVLSMDVAVGDLEVGDVLVEGGRIVAVGRDLPAEDAVVVDASDTIVIPGFVDTHRHTWQAAVRNIAADWTLAHYFTGLHAGLSGYFRPQDTYASNLLGSLEALSSGITTLLDWSHNLNTPDHADGAIAGLMESGGRAVFAHGGGAAQYQVPSDVSHPVDARRIREQYFSSDDQLVTMAMALRGPQYARHDITRDDFALARELGARITVHVGDGDWGKGRPVAWMHAEGLLGPDVTYVHCNTIADDEIAMIAASGGTASVAADVEMQMGHGFPATGRLIDAGIRPSLSIDTCSSNGGHMFGAMRSTVGVQRALDHAAADAAGLPLRRLRVSCRDALEFATIEGARAVGLGGRIGSLTPGKEADIVLVRTDDLSMMPLNHPYGALVYNAHPGLVDTVIVAGRVVKRDGRMVGVDSGRIRRLAADSRDHLIAQAQRHVRIADACIGGTWIPEPYVPA